MLFVLSAPLIPGTAMLGINTNSLEHLGYLSERGFPAKVVDHLAPHLGLRPADLLTLLRLRVSTPASRRHYARRYSSMTSVRLFRLAHLADAAHASVDEAASVYAWLRTPDTDHGGQIPLELAVGADGAAYVGRTSARFRAGMILGPATG